MFRTILVPTDGLDVGNSMFPTAQTLARLSGAEIILVHVLPGELSRGRSRLVDQRRHEFERLQRELEAPDLRVSWYIRYGHVPEQILRIACDLQVDLIAMVTLGLIGVDRVIAGTVCDEVLHRTEIPLLLSRWGTPPLCQLRRILVPTDGSPEASRALSVALPLAHASSASVTLLEVTEHPHDSMQLVPDSDNGVHRLAKQLVHNGYDATGVSCTGKPSKSIVEQADDLHADLIVMSTHARTGAARAIHGSVADAVVHQANAPVMLVHA